jgi:hypothetical protein
MENAPEEPGTENDPLSCCMRAGDKKYVVARFSTPERYAAKRYRQCGQALWSHYHRLDDDKIRILLPAHRSGSERCYDGDKKSPVRKNISIIVLVKHEPA